MLLDSFTFDIPSPNSIVLGGVAFRRGFCYSHVIIMAGTSALLDKMW